MLEWPWKWLCGLFHQEPGLCAFSWAYSAFCEMFWEILGVTWYNRNLCLLLRINLAGFMRFKMNIALCKRALSPVRLVPEDSSKHSFTLLLLVVVVVSLQLASIIESDLIESRGMDALANQAKFCTIWAKWLSLPWPLGNVCLISFIVWAPLLFISTCLPSYSGPSGPV